MEWKILAFLFCQKFNDHALNCIPSAWNWANSDILWYRSLRPLLAVLLSFSKVDITLRSLANAINVSQDPTSYTKLQTDVWQITYVTTIWWINAIEYPNGDLHGNGYLNNDRYKQLQSKLFHEFFFLFNIFGKIMDIRMKRFRYFWINKTVYARSIGDLKKRNFCSGYLELDKI